MWFLGIRVGKDWVNLVNSIAFDENLNNGYQGE